MHWYLVYCLSLVELVRQLCGYSELVFSSHSVSFDVLRGLRHASRDYM